MFVRWDNLKVDAEASRTLPGYREPATVRNFDAPEALEYKPLLVKRLRRERSRRQQLRSARRLHA